MDSHKKIKFVLVGGFLGAGKTTLIGALAKLYAARGKRVGIITNDQADGLVDTQNLRSQGFDVGEVAGACFCCSFNDLVSTAEGIIEREIPDVLLAEPVGSCTDLVATVIMPLQERLGDRFDLAPFGVLLKPSHALRLLAEDADAKRGGFSPQAEYIFHKQLEEADYLLITRSDQLSEQQIDSLKHLLAKAAPGVPVFAVSAPSRDGLDNVIDCIEDESIAGRRLLEIDYDIYAEGEAELGWVNLSARLLEVSSAIDLDHLASGLVSKIASKVTDAGGEIAHVKVSVLGGDCQAVANVVSNDLQVDVGLAAKRSVIGDLQIVINSRVAIDPKKLEEICHDAVVEVTSSYDATLELGLSHALRPGRPVPTFRVTV